MRKHLDPSGIYPLYVPLARCFGTAHFSGVSRVGTLWPLGEPAIRNTRVTVASYSAPKTLKASMGGARMKFPSEEASSSIPDC